MSAEARPIVELDPSGDPGGAAQFTPRWELYRVLADPVRVRLLALAAEEELGVGELAELLREGQPKVSRHAAALRDAGLLVARRQGTWTLLRLSPTCNSDPVVADALTAGRLSCQRDGTLARVAALVTARDETTREFFARGGRPLQEGPPPEIPSYLAALAPLVERRRLAIDAGTGDGALLEALAPIFDQVLAIDRSAAQLELAALRVERRGFGNVKLVQGELDGAELKKAFSSVTKRCATPGADFVIASRVLHHAPTPAKAFQRLVDLANPDGGFVAVLDYEAHDDQALRDREADLWLGFEPKELRQFAKDAKLADIQISPVPGPWRGEGPDRHLVWQLCIGRRMSASAEKR